jgi:hypothetical protein
MPDKLKQLQELFYAEARKYNVLPLDNTTLARWNTPRPSLTAGRTVFTYSGELSGTPASAAPDIKNKSYTITAEVEIPEGGAEGMIVTEGGRFGGYGLFLSKGEFGVGRARVVFLYNLLDLKRTMWEGPNWKPATIPSCSISNPTSQVWARAVPECWSSTGRKWRGIRLSTRLRSRFQRTRPLMSVSTPAPEWRCWSIATILRSSSRARLKS